MIANVPAEAMALRPGQTNPFYLENSSDTHSARSQKTGAQPLDPIDQFLLVIGYRHFDQ